MELTIFDQNNPRLIKAFKHAINGLIIAFGNERNLKIHAVIALVTCILGLLLDITGTEWVAIMVCIALVITAELANTAIEKTMNFLHPSYHESVKTIKDIAAGMVLFAALCAGIVGLIIFIPKLMEVLVQVGS